MNCHRVVEVLLGGAHPDGNREALQHLIRARTHHVQPDDALLGTRVTSFISTRGLTVGHRVVQRHEA